MYNYNQSIDFHIMQSHDKAQILQHSHLCNLCCVHTLKMVNKAYFSDI